MGFCRPARPRRGEARPSSDILTESREDQVRLPPGSRTETRRFGPGKNGRDRRRGARPAATPGPLGRRRGDGRRASRGRGRGGQVGSRARARPVARGAARTGELDAGAQPECVERSEGYERWHGRGALGYLTLAAVCAGLESDPPERTRLVVCEACFPTGMLGGWARRLADAGLVALVTATSPRRLPHPDGGPPLTGTNPIAIAVPSSDGPPVVADVSMGAVTHGDVLAGRARAGGARAVRRPARAQGVRARRRVSSSSWARSRGRSRGRSCSPPVPSTIPCPAFASWRAVSGFRATAARFRQGTADRPEARRGRRPSGRTRRTGLPARRTA